MVILLYRTSTIKDLKDRINNIKKENGKNIKYVPGIGFLFDVSSMPNMEGVMEIKAQANNIGALPVSDMGGIDLDTALTHLNEGISLH